MTEICVYVVRIVWSIDSADPKGVVEFPATGRRVSFRDAQSLWKVVGRPTSKALMSLLEGKRHTRASRAVDTARQPTTRKLERK